MNTKTFQEHEAEVFAEFPKRVVLEEPVHANSVESYNQMHGQKYIATKAVDYNGAELHYNISYLHPDHLAILQRIEEKLDLLLSQSS